MTNSKNRSMAAELFRFSMPLVLSGILQQLYNWADAFIVGHAEGELQLGAVGATHSMSILFTNTIIGFTLGLSIMGAQEYGRGNTQKIKRILTTFGPLLCVVYTLIAIAGILFTGTFLKVMDTPGEMFGYAFDYLRIILVGIPFLAVYNLYAALLRAVGNTKLSFYAVLLSSVLNVLLDILFVVILPYGVAGAAIATVISQVAMAVYIVITSTVKYTYFSVKREEWQFDRAVLKEGMGFSIPPTIQHSITSFGNLLLQNFMNGFGANTVLAITTAYRVDSLMLLPVFNLGAAVSSMVARAKGAEDRPKIKNCLKTGCIMGAVSSGVLALGMFMFGAVFVGMFGITGEALEIGRVFFRDLSKFYVLFGIATVTRSSLEGIGDISYCSLMGVVTLATRIGTSYLLRPFFMERTVAIAEGISWIVILVLMGIRVMHKRREMGIRE